MRQDPRVRQAWNGRFEIQYLGLQGACDLLTAMSKRHIILACMANGGLCTETSPG